MSLQQYLFLSRLGCSEVNSLVQCFIRINLLYRMFDQPFYSFFFFPLWTYCFKSPKIVGLNPTIYTHTNCSRAGSYDFQLSYFCFIHYIINIITHYFTVIRQVICQSVNIATESEGKAKAQVEGSTDDRGHHLLVFQSQKKTTSLQLSKYFFNGADLNHAVSAAGQGQYFLLANKAKTACPFSPTIGYFHEYQKG